MQYRPAQLRTPLLFPSPPGELLDLDNFRRREWSPAIEASGIATPARIYDPRLVTRLDALEAELVRAAGTAEV